MTTMLTTLEGNTDLTNELEGDLYIADNGKVYFESSLGEYSELGSVEEIFNQSISELSGNPEIEELLDGEAPILQDKEIDLYIHKNGKVYYKSPLGGYSELGSVEEIFNQSISELSGNSDFTDDLDGDELGKGFKFKAPKIKFKAPKFKFKAPKMKFKAPKMKLNTKGLSKGFKSIGNAVSSGVKAYGKAWEGVAKGAGKLASSIASGAGQLAEGLLNQEQPQGEEEQEEESQEEEQTDEIDQEQVNEESQEDNTDMTEEYTDEMSGVNESQTGKKYYYSELYGEYKELGRDELGFMEMLTSAAGMASGGNKSGLLSMATGALDMFVPGAGTLANVGLSAAQKQQAKKKAKKAANNAQRQKLLQFYNKKKQNPKAILKPKPTTPKQVIQTVQRQTPISRPVQEMTYAASSPATYRNTQPTARNETDYQPSQVEKDKKNQIAMGVGAVIVVIAIIYSMNKKKGKK